MSAEPTAGWFEGREHRLPVRVYYEDTDFTGAVYYANYLKFFERGRSDFLRLIGPGHSALLVDETAFAVTRIEVDYHRPARIDDALVVVTTFDALAGARVTIRQTLLRGDEPLVSAAVQVACIGLDKRPRRPPSALVQGLKPYLLSPETASTSLPAP